MPMLRPLKPFVLVLGACCASALVPAAAHADIVTFNSTGAEQTFTVPARVTSVHVVAIGAPGALAPRLGRGRRAGRVLDGATGLADLAVTPGEVLYVEVGGKGAGASRSAGGLGGFNGGGAAPSSSFDGGAGGGGSGRVAAPAAREAPPVSRECLPLDRVVRGPPTAAAALPDAAGAGGSDGAGSVVCSVTPFGGAGSLGSGGTGGGDTNCTSGGGGGGLYGGGGGGGNTVVNGGGGGGGGLSGFGAGATNTSVGADATATPSVTITFTPTFHTLAVARAGTGTGTVTSTDGQLNCGSTCSHSYPADTTVTLNASAEPGSTFAGWSGAGCSGTSSCTVTMNSEQSVTATFNAVPPPPPPPPPTHRRTQESPRERSIRARGQRRSSSTAPARRPHRSRC